MIRYYSNYRDQFFALHPDGKFYYLSFIEHSWSITEFIPREYHPITLDNISAPMSQYYENVPIFNSLINRYFFYKELLNDNEG